MRLLLLLLALALLSDVPSARAAPEAPSAFALRAAWQSNAISSACGQWWRESHGAEHLSADEWLRFWSEVEARCRSSGGAFGVVVDPIDAWCLVHHESAHHNLFRHCGSGPPSGRSSGLGALTAPAVAASAEALGLDSPHVEDFAVRDLWARATCYWCHGNVQRQARLLTERLASYLRASGGDLTRALSIYRYGHQRDRKYAADHAAIRARWWGRP